MLLFMFLGWKFVENVISYRGGYLALESYSRDSSSVENVQEHSTKAGELHPNMVKTPHNEICNR